MKIVIIFFILIVFIIGVILFIMMRTSSSNTSTSSKSSLDPTIAAALSAGKVAGSSAVAAFVPNYVPPNPVEENSLLQELINLLKDFTEQMVFDAAFNKFVEKLTPDRLKTWKGLFGNNKQLMDKMKVNRSESLVKRLSKKMIDSLKDVYGAAKLAIGQVTEKTAKRVAQDANAAKNAAPRVVQKAAVKAEVRAAEAAAKFGAKAAAEAETGPVGAALMVVEAAGMALDFIDINHLVSWQEYTTSAMDIQKTQSDIQFAKTANDNKLTLPLIAGPIDQIDPDIFSSMMESSEVSLLMGVITPSNPDDTKIINSIKFSIIRNFIKAVGGDSSSVTLRDAFSASTLSTLTDAQQQQISNIAYNQICIQAKGTLVNGTYCSFGDQKSCNLTDQDFDAYVAGAANSRSQYTEWKTKDYINQQYKITIDQANACIVQSSDMRIICQDGHKDIAGKMQYNSYDISSGRCFNTKQFCDSFGIQWDGATRTCTESSTLKIFDFVFGSTITQGTKMVIDRAIDGTVHTLDKLGPAGRFLGNALKTESVMYGAVTCAICTIFTNDVKILMDVFTGNFKDIENRLKSNIKQVEKAVDAVCGFFKAIAHDFFDLF